MALGEDSVVINGISKKVDVVATGEVGKTPKICVWHPNETMDLVVSLRGFHQRGVTQLCFSRETEFDDRTNRYLISLGLDDYHSVAVYDWRKNELLYNARTHKSTVLSLNANPNVDWSNGSDVLFCTAGVQHLLFWKKKGRGIVSKKATFGITKSSQKKTKRSKIIILCMDWFSDGTLVCGTSNGQLLMWSKGMIRREPKKNPPFNVYDLRGLEKHTPVEFYQKKTAINCLKISNRRTKSRDDAAVTEEYVMTGGQDGRIILYSKEKNNGGISLVDPSKLHSVLYVYFVFTLFS